MFADLLLKLGKKGLGSIVGLVQKKGTDIIKQKTGIDLSKESITDEEIEELKLYQENNRPEIMKLTNELTLGLEKEVTTRHATDMLSDSKLSKNIRPMSLIYMLGVFTALIVTVVFFIIFKVNTGDIFKILDMVVGFLKVIFGFYFTSRAVVGLAKAITGK